MFKEWRKMMSHHHLKQQATPPLVYPPQLEPDQPGTVLETLISNVKDYQITHGSLLKLVRYEQESTVPSRPVGATVFPTLFPKHCFEEACALQKSLNSLYVSVSEDDEWLESVLADLIANDKLIGILWNIHRKVKEEGLAQPLTMGVFRSDYMLHRIDDEDTDIQKTCLKQVECNHYFVAGGVHGNIVSDMHRHLHRTGAYDFANGHFDFGPATMPNNNTLAAIVTGLADAHEAYGPPKCRATKQTCILYIVQPRNFNICDERPIEYGLWDRGVSTFRLTFGQDVLNHTYLTTTRELIYSPPGSDGKTLFEVSVIYMRAAHDLSEFDATGQAARLQLERSRAVKCPSIACHLTTLKKVQQALTESGALTRFLTIEEADRVGKIFMPMYCLDGSSDGLRMRHTAMDPLQCINYVLKPNLEGGGHNIYRSDIPSFLANIPQHLWSHYILMELIQSPRLNNYLVMPAEIYHGPVVSELGIFGICMWERSSNESQATTMDSASVKNASSKPRMLKNEQRGWSLKTKNRDVDEMSCVKGYGAFSSPLLI